MAPEDTDAAMEGEAATLTGFGASAAEVIEIAPRSFELLDPNVEVLVKVLACGVNVSDLKAVAGLMPFVKTPVVTGRDFCGTVVDGPAELVGSLVYGTGGTLGYRRDGSHAQYLCLPVDCVAGKPGNLSHEEAGTVGVPYVTAYEAVVNKARTAEGELVVVQGGTGMVGSAALQLAKARGAKTVALVRREAASAIKGADHIINTKGLAPQDLQAKLADLSGKPPGESGADVFIDTVGGPSTTLGISCLRANGRLVTLSAPKPSDEASFNVFEFYRKQLQVSGINTLAFSDQYCANIMTKLAPLFESGEISPLPVNLTRFALSELPRAYAEVAKGAHSRVAVLPWGPNPV